MNINCSWCGGSGKFVYYMRHYPVYQCRHCGTGFVHPMPGTAELKELYNDFIPQLSIKSLDRMKNVTADLLSQIGVRKKRAGLRMLDIGGGGGFYCKAFELMGYGSSVYVDLDPVSCRFARKELGLKNVTQADALQWIAEAGGLFDFIHCRHVIEHMADPVGFCDALIKAISPGGVLLLQLPNGDSLEYLAYWHLNVLNRLRNISDSNDFSRLRTLWYATNGRLLHGMDPPRHLWAVSRQGLRSWTYARMLSGEIFTKHLGNRAFSLGFQSSSKILPRIRDMVGQHVLSRINGGTHLVALIRKRVIS